MKKITIFLAITLVLNTIDCLAQQTKTKKDPEVKVDTRVDNMGYWNRMADLGLVQRNPVIPFKPAEFKGSVIEGKGIMVQDSPDVAVTSSTSVTQTENSVFVDPDNNQFVLNSNNSTNWTGSTVSTLYGANYFQTSNGGASWGGSTAGAGGTNSGDPTTAINHAGRQFVGYISASGGMGVSYSDNGSAWTAVNVYSTGNQDKNHMWIDNATTSPYQNYLYNAWVDLQSGSANYADIILSRSTNNGTSWSSVINLSNALNAGSHNQGVNIQTGPNGEVYAIWAVYDSWPSDETAIGYAKSTNGGASFAAPSRIITNIRGIRTTGVPQNMRVNSFPVMAVDISGGTNNGNIYVVWSNIGTPGVNSGTAGVYMIKSTNGGSTWSSPVKVNQGTGTAYLPWITCDQETGVIAVVFYDNRNTATASCETWVAYSLDAGNTWTDFRVSDVTFTPAPISGLATGYMGDYLGITAKGGRFYPCWTDNRSGYMTYVSPFTIGLNAAFTANITNVCSGSSVNFTDQSTGNPTSWSWSFPGGTPSSYNGHFPPAITYSTPGTYNVSLTVSDGVNNNTMTKTGYITVQNIFADFTGSPTTVVVGNTVTFTDNSSCNPTSWNWSFSGGTPSTATGQGPHIITYNTIGTYNVSLTATNSLGNDTETKSGYISVISPVFNITNGTVTTCSGNFYDSGGSGGAYTNNENFTETFYPSTSGAMLQFVFSSFSTESGYDYLRIYDGTSTSATLIGTYNGTTGPGTVTATNVSGALTFNFTSDVSITSTGWAASINCIIPTYPGLWKGTTSTNWNTASNWDDGTVPTAGVNVTIPSSAPNWPVRTGDLTLGTTCNNITMNGSSELTVTGNLTVPSGKTLTCSANSTIHVGGNWSNSGTFNYGSGTLDFYNTATSTINTTTTTVYLINENMSTWPGNWNGDVGGGAGYFGTSATATAGGVSPEAKFTRNGNTLTTTRQMYYDPVNTSGLTSATLTFKHMVDARATANYTLSVDYSTNGLNWTNAGWSMVNPVTDIGPATVNIPLNTSLGIGNSSYYLAFTITGNIRNINAWYIDDVQLTYTSAGTLNVYNLQISKGNALAATFGNINVNNNLVVKPDAWFTNNSGNTITVSGNALFEASASGMASFINNGTFNVTGTTTVQQYLTSQKWHLVSPPVTGATINAYYNTYLKEYNEPSNSWTYLYQPTTMPMNVGQGYSAWASDGLTGTTTVLYTGSLNNSNINLSGFSYSPATNTTHYGFRLIGNPYPCAIDWNTSWPQTNLSGWAVIYDNGISRGWHPTLGGYNGMTNGIIPSSQGFWVRATSAAATLTIPLSARVHNAQAFYKDTQLSMYPIIRLNASGNGFTDETVITFLADATDDFDGYYDLEKFFNIEESPQLYSMAGNRNYGFNVMAPEYKDKVVQLGFENTLQGNYKLYIAVLENLDPGINVYLEDILTGQVSKLSEGMAIYFDHNPLNEPHRFNLHFKDSYFGEDELSGNEASIYAFGKTIYIETPGLKAGQIKIYNVIGQEIHRSEITAGNRYGKINLNDETGYYFVKVQTGDQVITQKVFIR